MKRFLLSALAMVALGCMVTCNVKVSKNAETFPIEPASITIFHK
jgi:hypothetical protein